MKYPYPFKAERTINKFGVGITIYNEEVAWVTSTTDLKLGSIFEHEVIPRLKAANLID